MTSTPEGASAGQALSFSSRPWMHCSLPGGIRASAGPVGRAFEEAAPSQPETVICQSACCDGARSEICATRSWASGGSAR